jgi:hypothetical protein
MVKILNVYIYSVYHILHVIWNLYMTLGHPYKFGPMPHPETKLKWEKHTMHSSYMFFFFIFFI